MKILFIVPYPTEGASNRVRVEAFLPLLRKDGVRCRVRPFASPGFYRILYKKGHYLSKALYFAAATINRMLDIPRALFYDIIFIHREAFPLGPAVFEYAFRLMGRKLIFDFDDAIYLPRTSRTNIFMERLKRPSKTKDIIKMSDLVIAGNEHLAGYARKYSGNVVVIPSSVDTDRYYPRPASPSRGRTVIGWTGSVTTDEFLLPLRGVFAGLNAKYDGSLEYCFVGGRFAPEGVENARSVPWDLSGESASLSGFDIGIMPMPDDEWTRGKCGYKALLYMSMGIPVVASPVGVNTAIIKHGVNGFLAGTGGEWSECLSRLIEDEGLRKRMGEEGRRTVEERYSVKANYPRLLEAIREVHEKKS